MSKETCPVCGAPGGYWTEGGTKIALCSDCAVAMGYGSHSTADHYRRERDDFDSYTRCLGMALSEEAHGKAVKQTVLDALGAIPGDLWDDALAKAILEVIDRFGLSGWAVV